MRRTIFLVLGVAWLTFLAVAYFIPLEVDSGGNYVVRDSLLGIIIFHHPVILALYLLAGIVLIALKSGIWFQVTEYRKALKASIRFLCMLKGGIL